MHPMLTKGSGGTDPDAGTVALAFLVPLIGLLIAIVRMGTQRPGGRILAASVLGAAAWLVVLFVLPALWDAAVQGGMRR